MENYIESIAEKLVPNIQKQTESYYIEIDGSKFQKGKYIDRQLSDFDFLDSNGMTDLHVQYLRDSNKKKEDGKKIIKVLNELLKPQRHEITTVLPTTSEFDYNEFVPCINMLDSKKFLVKATTGRKSTYEYDAWAQVVPGEIRKDLAIRPCILNFDPYQEEPFLTKKYENKDILHINSYIHPEWMRDERDWAVFLTEEEKENLYCPPEIMEFFEHLFPDDENREFVFNWLHHALVDRCETYLVLNGKKGVGKGILCEYILQNLVGSVNYRIAPESILESNFNAALEDIRLLVMDEVKADKPSKVSKLKKYANKVQNIENKGIDATKTKSVHYSAVISNNDLDDMKLEWDERRFSVVDLSEDTLLDKWGVDKIDEFIDMFQDRDFVKAFGYWVFYYEPSEKYHSKFAFKGERFWDIVRNSLSEWKRYILDIVLDEESDNLINLNNLRSDYKKFSPMNQKMKVTATTISKFLHEFRWKGSDNLGKLIYDDMDSEWYLEKEEKFKSRKSVSETQNEDFDLL